MAQTNKIALVTGDSLRIRKNFSLKPAERGINFITTYYKAMTAFVRLGKPDDIGDGEAFLYSKKAGWITAQRIEVSGGINL